MEQTVAFISLAAVVGLLLLPEKSPDAEEQAAREYAHCMETKQDNEHCEIIVVKVEQ